MNAKGWNPPLAYIQSKNTYIQMRDMVVNSTGCGCKQHWLIISFCRKMEHTKNVNTNIQKYLCSQTVISL